MIDEYCFNIIIITCAFPSQNTNILDLVKLPRLIYILHTDDTQLKNLHIDCRQSWRTSGSKRAEGSDRSSSSSPRTESLKHNAPPLDLQIIPHRPQERSPFRTACLVFVHYLTSVRERYSRLLFLSVTVGAIWTISTKTNARARPNLPRT